MKVSFAFLVLALFAGHAGGKGLTFSYYPMDGKNGDLLNKQEMTIQDVAEKFLFSGEGALRKFASYRGAKKIPYIYFPVLPSAGVAEVFGVSPNIVSGGAWVGLLKGQFVANKSGRFRLVGLGDEVLVVRVNGRAVLDARGTFYPTSEYKLKVEYLSTGGGASKRNLRAGPWITLTKGVLVSFEVLIGAGGGDWSAYLLGSEKNDKDVEGGKGKYPLLVFGEDPAVSRLAESHSEEGDQSPIEGILSFASQSRQGDFVDRFSTTNLDPRRNNKEEEMGVTEDAAFGGDGRWTGEFHIQSRPTGKVKAVLTGWYRYSSSFSKWTFQSPVAPETLGQKNATNYFAEKGVRLNSKVSEIRSPDGPRQAFVEAGWQQDRRDTNAIFPISVVYETQLFSSRLVPGQGTTPAEKLSSSDRRVCLSLDWPFDVERGEVRRWIDDNGLMRKKGERDLAFASRVQSFMVGHFLYNADKRLELKDVLRFKGIACGESALLFGAIMRLNKIPARMRAGRWAQTQVKIEEGNEDTKLHVKVDFYAEGIGWLVVEFPYGESDPAKIAEHIGTDGGFLTIQINPLVKNRGEFIFNQGFLGYGKNAIQQIAYEWWEVEHEEPSSNGEP